MTAPPKSLRERAWEEAKKWVWNPPLSENPPGSNHGQHIDGWQRRAAGTTGIPWCACFLWCMFEDAGQRLQVRYPAAVASWVDFADQRAWVVKRPLRWDVVAYSWDGQTNHPNDHIGIIERVLALPSKRTAWRYYIRTVEGNADNAVRRKWRLVDPKTVAFLRIKGF